MDFQSYDDYMRSVLGFSNMNCPNMSMNTQFPCSNMYMNTQNMCQSCDLEGMFPDTYRIIYPMVVSACDMATMPITEEMLCKMTDDIYDRAVLDNRISSNINIDSRESNTPRQSSNDVRIRMPRRNPIFRDLIRILLLRELLRRRPGFRPF